MNKLKEISNKFYQEAEVAMLATNSKSQLHLVPKGEYDENFGILEKELLLFDNTPSTFGYPAQHLYFLSNEEIKEGDWCFEVYNGLSKAPKDTPRFTDKDANIWWLRQMNMNCSANDPECKKIITTTDKLMNNDLSHVPQPSQSFIQAFIKSYNEGKPITKVLVEMRSFDTLEYNSNEFKKAWENNKDYILKVNSSNEITIKKTKDSYTREEIEHLLHKCWLAATAKTLEPLIQPGFKTFIEENL